MSAKPVRGGEAIKTHRKVIHQTTVLQEVTLKAAAYLKLTFSQYQTDEDTKIFRKIFMYRVMSNEKRDSEFRQQVVDAPPCHT